MGTSLSWTVCNAEERQCAGLFLEVSDPRAAHSALCSDAQLSMQYFRAGVGCSQSLPVRSPSLAAPSSDCSSYGNTKKRRCIQDRQKRAKTDWKHYDWQEWWADSTKVRSRQVFKLPFRIKGNKQMTTLEEKKIQNSQQTFYRPLWNMFTLSSAFLLFWIHENKNDCANYSCFHHHEDIAMVMRWKAGISVKNHANVAFMSRPRKSKDDFIKSNLTFDIKSFQVQVLNVSQIMWVS